jgi:hypothetical protein
MSGEAIGLVVVVGLLTFGFLYMLVAVLGATFEGLSKLGDGPFRLSEKNGGAKRKRLVRRWQSGRSTPKQ